MKDKWCELKLKFPWLPKVTGGVSKIIRVRRLHVADLYAHQAKAYYITIKGEIIGQAENELPLATLVKGGYTKRLQFIALVGDEVTILLPPLDFKLNELVKVITETR